MPRSSTVTAGSTLPRTPNSKASWKNIGLYGVCIFLGFREWIKWTRRWTGWWDNVPAPGIFELGPPLSTVFRCGLFSHDHCNTKSCDAILTLQFVIWSPREYRQTRQTSRPHSLPLVTFTTCQQLYNYYNCHNILLLLFRILTIQCCDTAGSVTWMASSL